MASDAAQPIEDMGTSQLAGRQVLDIAAVRGLSARSNLRGALRACGHFGYLGLTGYGVWLTADNGWLRIPLMLLLGVGIVTMFAAMHECVHRTAFQSRRLNDLVGWIAGALCLYNFNYYRRYHTWHHRYTQDPQRDPELSTPKPTSLGGYIYHLSGVEFWLSKPRELASLALGRGAKYPYIAEGSVKEVTISAALQVALYAALLLGSILFRTDVALIYWFLPAVLAQPVLRALLIVEHTGCSADLNGLTNTRTTLASWPIRFLMWNMPFHAEHHLYPSIPFFRLPAAHQDIKSRLEHLSPSYPAANLEVVRSLHHQPGHG